MPSRLGRLHGLGPDNEAVVDCGCELVHPIQSHLGLTAQEAPCLFFRDAKGGGQVVPSQFVSRHLGMDALGEAVLIKHRLCDMRWSPGSELRVRYSTELFWVAEVSPRPTHDCGANGWTARHGPNRRNYIACGWGPETSYHVPCGAAPRQRA